MWCGIRVKCVICNCEWNVNVNLDNRLVSENFHKSPLGTWIVKIDRSCNCGNVGTFEFLWLESVRNQRGISWLQNPLYWYWIGIHLDLNLIFVSFLHIWIDIQQNILEKFGNNSKTIIRIKEWIIMMAKGLLGSWMERIIFGIT